jgi:hypothetical protein
MSDVGKPGNSAGVRFVKGQSGNPGGRSKVDKKIRVLWNELAGGGDDAGLREWVTFTRGIMLSEGETTRNRLVAGKQLKEAGFGAAKQTIDFVGDEAPAIAPIDWSQVPLEQRKRLLGALREIDELTELAGAHGSTSEH